jgi:hypothetical protein
MDEQRVALRELKRKAAKMDRVGMERDVNRISRIIELEQKSDKTAGMGLALVLEQNQSPLDIAHTLGSLTVIAKEIEAATDRYLTPALFFTDKAHQDATGIAVMMLVPMSQYLKDHPEITVGEKEEGEHGTD